MHMQRITPSPDAPYKNIVSGSCQCQSATAKPAMRRANARRVGVKASMPCNAGPSLPLQRALTVSVTA
jgi:hypothetical protein